MSLPGWHNGLGQADLDDFPDAVSIDVRFTCAPEDLPFLVQEVEHLAHSEGFGFEYPPGDGLPYEHTLIDVSEFIGE